MYAEKKNFAEIKKFPRKAPVVYYCDHCQNSFPGNERTNACSYCYSSKKSNLVIMHLEDDSERIEWLECLELTAGD